MNLQTLLSVIPEFKNRSLPNIEVTGIYQDARQVTLGSVFIAIPGSKVDGHSFISDAIKNGAIVLIVSKEISIPGDYSGFVGRVSDSRLALDLLAAQFYQNPSAELFCVGVTGTNGKTSTTYMVECILNAIGKTGVIGTVNHHLGSQVWPSEMTTPDPVFLQKRLAEFKQAGAQFLSIEVSSHALDQHRVESLAFNVGIFTNLTRDHLDYHKNMQEYFLAKQRLFDELLDNEKKFPTFAIIHSDDCWGRRIQVGGATTLWTYGEKDADFRYQILEEGFDYTKFILLCPFGEQEYILPMAGRHNVQNAVAAIATGVAAGVSLPLTAAALQNFTGVPGRLQIVPNRQGLYVFVDYAHSPDALENVLKTLNRTKMNSNLTGQIWTVFGCGGDRDKGKRPQMADIASKLSDKIIITSDNPRTEHPDAILDDIEKGIPQAEKSKCTRMVDRKSAIQHAIFNAKPGDVILIAGKGHEDYQIIGKEKIHFSDFEVAKEVLG